jgi:hypothetical protein
MRSPFKGVQVQVEGNYGWESAIPLTSSQVVL